MEPKTVGAPSRNSSPVQNDFLEELFRRIRLRASQIQLLPSGGEGLGQRRSRRATRRSSGKTRKCMLPLSCSWLWPDSAKHAQGHFRRLVRGDYIVDRNSKVGGKGGGLPPHRVAQSCIPLWKFLGPYGRPWSLCGPRSAANICQWRGN